MDENMDLSKAFEKVQQMLSDENGEGQLQNLLGMLSGSQGSENSPSPESGGLDLSSLFSGTDESNADANAPFDLEMIMKLQNIMSAMNQQKSDANSVFLKSLKPLLKKERQIKIDQAVKIMGVAKAFKLFKKIDKGGI
ncbi:MAG: hypothetical protein IKW64_07790 [Clostridia bacterium]|nr:hypothetical protein [Clostridia bacterium]